MKLRPYQQRSFDAITAGWEDAERQLAVMATGAGKTILFSHLAAAEPGATLILAHREELLQQAVTKLHSATGIFAQIEAGGRSVLPGHRVTVASVQTMRRRLAKWNPNAFDFIIADEAHHCLSDEWRTVLSHFTGCHRVLGVTATPDRSDKKKLGVYFQRVAAEVGLLELIRDGYLSPIRCKRLDVELDMGSLRRRGEYTGEQVAGALSPKLQALADAVAAEIWDRKALVFLPICEISERFSEALSDRGINCKHVAGDSVDREETLKWFAQPGVRTLCNAMLLTEGYDQPDVDCIVMLRATQSGSLYAQIVGRGTRTAKGKDHCLILDPMWITGDHKLCQPADIVASSPLHRDALQSRLDLGEDLLEAEAKAQDDVEAKLAANLKKGQKKKAPKGTIDPLAYALALHDGDLADWSASMPWEEEEATEGQRKALAAWGLWNAGDTMCRGYASALLTRISERKAAGLASPKQVALLKKLGHANPELCTPGDAGYFISQNL